MLLQEYQRFALECTLVVGKMPEDAPNFNLEKFLPKLVKFVNDNKAVHKTKDDTVSLRLSKVETEEKYISLLFQYADKNAADPSFSHTETGKTRTVYKEAGEGISVSAHLIINRKPTGELFNTYHDAVLEEVPGISRSVIEAGLTHILSECAVEEFEREDAKKPIKCRPKISLRHNGSAKLNDLLKNGTINGFVAVKTRVDNSLDEEGELKVADERLVLKVKRSRGEKALALINKAKDKIKDRQYSKLQIRYKGDNKRSSTLDVGVREENIAEKMFAKSSQIDVDEPIAQCQEIIHTKLKSKMVLILNRMIEEND
ncbi:hypothetical protein SOPP22_02845 [Shewanella sp. OPT22]|nr:hypothetical protein SOPP22_02845 [Shewanella sp. OPT22]